ncbi:2'-5' RNA ligase family protein [Sphingobacterium corticis]|uniref:2'-5' RNA ligase family protein n=1 Tax=Sphingobacterium corticis TaxID=1812823 RepID=A0ABW5NKK7_9SPHI
MSLTKDKVIYILTLRLDKESQIFFNRLREEHFPRERNFLQAHLTLFHQLPDHPRTFQNLQQLKMDRFDMKVNGLMHLGSGVAYTIESEELLHLHQELSSHFSDCLIPQDQQRFKPHITIQNKATPEVSKRLFEILNHEFVPFTIQATGIDLWIYKGGPWEFNAGFDLS